MANLDLFDVDDDQAAPKLPGPKSTGSLASRLSEVNWDFPNRVTHSEIEGLHPYPAKFIAELPRALLDILPIDDGHAVLDPFCGSGTTLVEAQAKGYASVGIDLNPIACLMSRVKTSRLPKTSTHQHSIWSNACALSLNP